MEEVVQSCCRYNRCWMLSGAAGRSAIAEHSSSAFLFSKGIKGAWRRQPHASLECTEALGAKPSSYPCINAQTVALTGIAVLLGLLPLKLVPLRLSSQL